MAGDVAQVPVTRYQVWCVSPSFLIATYATQVEAEAHCAAWLNCSWHAVTS